MFNRSNLQNYMKSMIFLKWEDMINMFMQMFVYEPIAFYLFGAKNIKDKMYFSQIVKQNYSLT